MLRALVMTVLVTVPKVTKPPADIQDIVEWMAVIAIVIVAQLARTRRP